MELIKQNIHMNKLKCKSDLQITLDDDFNVPDVKADIYKIIKEQGEVKIQDLKISNGKIITQGDLIFNFLKQGRIFGSGKKDLVAKIGDFKVIEGVFSGLFIIEDSKDCGSTTSHH